MRYEGKDETEAVAAAARERGVEPAELRYRVVRDEKSFWGGHVVEIEVEQEGSRRPPAASEIARARLPSLSPTAGAARARARAGWPA